MRVAWLALLALVLAGCEDTDRRSEGGTLERDQREAVRAKLAANQRNALALRTQVIIQDDPGAAHGQVVAIMEMAKHAGLTRLALGTK